MSCSSSDQTSLIKPPAVQVPPSLCCLNETPCLASFKGNPKWRGARRNHGADSRLKRRRVCSAPRCWLHEHNKLLHFHISSTNTDYHSSTDWTIKCWFFSLQSEARSCFSVVFTQISVFCVDENGSTGMSVPGRRQTRTRAYIGRTP